MKPILLISESDPFKKLVTAKLDALMLEWIDVNQVTASPHREWIGIVDIGYLDERAPTLLPLQETYQCALLLLSPIPHLAEGYPLMREGLRAYANQHIATPHLLNALETLLQGGTWYDPAFMKELLTHVTPSTPNAKEPLLELSEREREVAHYVALGMSNPHIAEEMNISQRTVKAHLQSCYRKLHVNDRIGLALIVKKGIG